MELPADRYYRASGAVPLRGTLTMLIGGLLVLIPLSFVYSLIQHYVTFEKPKGLVLVVFACLVGLACRGLAKWGAVRSRGFAGLVGLALGCFAIYFAWMTSLLLLFDWDPEVLRIGPMSMVEEIELLANAGIWQRDGKPLGPTELYLLWGTEALGVIGAAAALSMGNKDPYCEACGRWTNSATAAPLPLTDSEKLRNLLECEQYTALLELTDRPSPEAHIVPTLYRCPTCEDSDFLTLSTLRVVQKKKETKSTLSIFVSQLRIPRQISDWLRNRGLNASGALPSDEAPPASQSPGSVEADPPAA